MRDIYSQIVNTLSELVGSDTSLPAGQVKTVIFKSSFREFPLSRALFHVRLTRTFLAPHTESDGFRWFRESAF